MNEMKITLIAAMDGKDGIGKNGSLPWHIPEDLKHFKAYTEGKVCVMGRKTWDSSPVKPLPNRENWVLASKDTPNLFGQGVSVMALSTESLINLAHDEQANELCIIGGASIYEQFLPHATHIVLTHIDANYGCDTFFPEFNKDEWSLISGKQLTTDALVRYWERRQ